MKRVLSILALISSSMTLPCGAQSVETRTYSGCLDDPAVYACYVATAQLLNVSPSGAGSSYFLELTETGRTVRNANLDELRAIEDLTITRRFGDTGTGCGGPGTYFVGPVQNCSGFPWEMTLPADGAVNFVVGVACDYYSVQPPIEGYSPPGRYCGYYPIFDSGSPSISQFSAEHLATLRLTATPEPASLALLATGLVGMAGLRRRTTRAAR